jgi:hypothetical protein
MNMAGDAAQKIDERTSVVVQMISFDRCRGLSAWEVLDRAAVRPGEARGVGLAGSGWRLGAGSRSGMAVLRFGEVTPQTRVVPLREGIANFMQNDERGVSHRRRVSPDLRSLLSPE